MSDQSKPAHLASPSADPTAPGAQARAVRSPSAAARPASPAERGGGAMPSWLPKAMLLAGLILGGLYVVYVLAGKLRALLILLAISFFLSLAVEPAVNNLARRGWKRGLATGVVFLGVLAFVVLFTVAIGSLFVDQVAEVVQGFPSYVESAAGVLNNLLGSNLSGSEWADQIRSSQAFQDFTAGMAATALNAGTTVLGLVFSGFTIGLFAFYLTAGGPRLRRTVCSLLPPDRQRHVLTVWDLAIEKTGGWVYSRGLLAAISAVATFVFLTVLDVPYALALAIWVGLVSQFVPAVGAYLAGVVPVLVALLNDPVDALWVIAFLAVYQQVENYLLSPKITAQTMELNPAVAFGSVLAGGALLGAVGALLALPFAASLQAFLSLYARRYEVVEDELTTEHVPQADAAPGQPEAAAGVEGSPAQPEPQLGTGSPRP